MQFNKWVLYIGAFVLAQIIGWVGEGVTIFLDASDVNDAVGFQIDREPSGAGFIGLLRNVLDFSVVLLPKLLFFNFSFLQGNLQLVQWILIMVFGGTLVLMAFGNRILGGR